MTADNDEYKSILREAGLRDETDEMAILLKNLSTEPHRYGRVEPPAGYENHLIAALKTRLPLEAKRVQTPPQQASFWSFFTSRQMAWSFSGVMTLVVGVLAIQSVRHVETPASADFLMQTAQRGNAEAVERWLASVADFGVQTQDLHQGALTGELSRADAAVARRALDDVAKSLGLANGI
jgi:hypothetical protein